MIMMFSQLEPSGRCCTPHLVNERLGPHGTEQLPDDTVNMDFKPDSLDNTTVVVKEDLSSLEILVVIGAIGVIGVAAMTMKSKVSQ